jgi:riboflavin synthase
VVGIEGDEYVVTAIKETMVRTNLGEWKVGDKVNVERCTQMNGRLDGHIVQGHVDSTAKVVKIENEEGSWKVHFEYAEGVNQVTVEKGSITVNGVSLTVVDSHKNGFTVAIIPYTWEQTNFHAFQPGSTANIEFDIVGKYVKKLLELRD